MPFPFPSRDSRQGSRYEGLQTYPSILVGLGYQMLEGTMVDTVDYVILIEGQTCRTTARLDVIACSLNEAY